MVANKAFSYHVNINIIYTKKRVEIMRDAAFTLKHFGQTSPLSAVSCLTHSYVHARTRCFLTFSLFSKSKRVIDEPLFPINRNVSLTH